jgi:ubiquinone/menaquinone biosynthesis C-methylase UbiE
MSNPEAVHAYPLGHEARELDRLTLQARLFEPLTRRLFGAAGLATGMRVLDVGSGVGDVAFLVREFVGPQGEVVGVDRAPAALVTAASRAEGRGFSNVHFVEADLGRRLQLFDTPFDAIVGRMVLMHTPNPAAVLGRVIEHVRPAGLVVFQELDTHSARAVPPAPTFDNTINLINKALEAAGSDNAVGVKFRRIFNAAGLPTPEFRFEALVAAESGHPAYSMVAEIARTLLPLMEKFGLATAAQVDPDTLASRMDAEVNAAQGVIVSPSLVGAWTRKP